MKPRNWGRLIASSLVLATAILITCGATGVYTIGATQTPTTSLPATTTSYVIEDAVTGTVSKKGKSSTLDYSNVNDGYFMLNYTGKEGKIKMQVKKVGGTKTYTYDVLNRNEFQSFPLSDGDGTYTVTVLINVSGTSYSLLDSYSFTAKLDNEFEPYLRPNQYVDYTGESLAVAKSYEVVTGATTELQKVEKIYDYVVSNVSYDHDEAAVIAAGGLTGYLPTVDEVLTTRKGICFDYGSLTAAMLRAQDIPCQLVIGYAGTAYHAWINVYTAETGWIDKAIEFNGDDWSRMDPTFISSSKGSAAVQSYVGDGSNYNPMYFY